MSLYWLVPALLVSLAGCWFAFSRDSTGWGAAFVVVTFGLVYLWGRQIEGQRDEGWEAFARQAKGRFAPSPNAALLETFGPHAPWTVWAHDGELQCTRAIDGSGADYPFALLQVRYSVRQRRGEDQPDAWHEVTVAMVPIETAGAPSPVPAGDGYEAVRDSRHLFVWKKGRPGAGASLHASELSALLAQAQRLALRLSPAAPARSSAAPAGPAHAAHRTPPR